MPTNNPRIQVMVTPEVDFAIERLSKASGFSKSTLCASIINAQAATFVKLAQALEAAQGLPADVRKRIAREVLPTDSELGDLQREVGAHLDEILKVYRDAGIDRAATPARAPKGRVGAGVGALP